MIFVNLFKHYKMNHDIRIAYNCLKNCPSITEDKNRLKNLFQIDEVNVIVNSVDLIIINKYPEISADFGYCVNLSNMRSFSEIYLNQEESNNDLYKVVNLLKLMMDDINIAKNYHYNNNDLNKTEIEEDAVGSIEEGKVCIDYILATLNFLMDIIEGIEGDEELDTFYSDIDKILPNLEDIQKKYTDCFNNIKVGVEIIQKIRNS